MKVSAHFVVAGAAIMHMVQSDDEGTIKITVESIEHERICIEVRNLTELILDQAAPVMTK